MKFTVSIDGTGRSFACGADQNVLAAMTLANARGVQVGCRSGGCGVCRVQVLEGQWRCGTMSRSEVGAEQLRDGHVLACKLYPTTDLLIRPVGRLVATAAMAEGTSYGRRGGKPGASMEFRA